MQVIFFNFLENPLFPVLIAILIIFCLIMAVRTINARYTAEMAKLERKNSFLEVKVTTLEQELIEAKANFEASLIGNLKRKGK